MSAASGPAQVPLGQLTDIKILKGPTAIKSEEGLLASYVFIDFSGRDVGGYVEEAKQKAAGLKLPAGYRLEWSGEYEYLIKTHERLKLVIPLTALIIFVLIYLNTKSIIKTAIVLLAVPFSLVGSFWLLYLLDYNMSIAVWVGIIAWPDWMRRPGSSCSFTWIWRMPSGKTRAGSRPTQTCGKASCTGRSSASVPRS